MSRRTLLAGALGLGAGALLAACGSDDDDGQTTTPESGADDAEPTATEAASAPTATAATASTDVVFPVTIDHKFGSTTIESTPKRIVSVGYNDQDPLLALGVKPLAVRYWYGDEPFAVWPWAREELGDAEPQLLGESGELDFEAIAALEPDLIIGVYSGMSQEEYDTLARIAPTVAQPGDYIDYGTPWQEMTRIIGRAVGYESRAEELIAEVEGLFAAAREAHSECEGKTVVVGAPDGAGQFGFVASEDPRTRVMHDLGFVMPVEFDEIAGDQFYGSVSLERADLLDQDLIVFFQLDWVEGGRAAIESDPLLSRLDALNDGRAVYLAGELDSALAFNSVLSLPYFLEAFLPMLETSMDGDPATVVAGP